LNEAVAALKAGLEAPEEEPWSPTIALGAPVLIPESYVADLSVRMALYKRLSSLETDAELDGFAAELIDRFGPVPKEIDDLLAVVAIKALCRRANIDKVEAGPKGVIVGFRDKSFANPTGLVRYVADKGPTAKVRQDMRIVFAGDFEKLPVRLKQTRKIVGDIALIAQRKKVA